MTNRARFEGKFPSAVKEGRWGEFETEKYGNPVIQAAWLGYQAGLEFCVECNQKRFRWLKDHSGKKGE